MGWRSSIITAVAWVGWIPGPGKFGMLFVWKKKKKKKSKDKIKYLKYPPIGE